MPPSSALGTCSEPRAARPDRFDAVLIGGGLQNALLLLALRRERPRARVALVEATPRLGGNHTWCFHAGDVAPEASAIVAPLVERRWPGYRVRFPGLERRLPSPYAMITSARLASVVEADFCAHPDSELVLGRRASADDEVPGRVRLDDCRVLEAPLVSDARGPERLERGASAGYQKFVGLELELDADAPTGEPLLMDACVDQSEGFRFVYVLPWSARRVLIEDTYYSPSAALEVVALRERVLDYAARSGYRVRAVVRQEQGVLPIPLAASAPSTRALPLELGYGGGWFHPTTGYSLPIALRVASAVARAPAEALAGVLERLGREHARQARYCVLLNRMLFGAFAPSAQRNVLERFYRLPPATIERFYALALTPQDRLRIVCGRPPRGLSLRRLVSGHARPSAAPPPRGELV